MHFEITASHQAVGKMMTTQQRSSSYYSESPRIGATTLRRGTVLKMTKEQMAASEVAIKRLYNAHAIEIVEVDGENRRNLRDAEEKFKQSGKKVVDDFNDALGMRPVEGPTSLPPVPVSNEIPPVEPVNESFPTAEELAASVATENKQVEEAPVVAPVVVEEVVAAPVEEAPEEAPVEEAHAPEAHKNEHKGDHKHDHKKSHKKGSK